MKIHISSELEGLCVQGEGMLLVSDLEKYIRREGAPRDPMGVGFELCEGITDVEAGFFDGVKNLTQIVIARSVKSIGLTEKTREILAKSDTVIRGEFDTFAERFARENGLCFLHCDIQLAQAGDYNERGRDTITLQLFSNGSAVLNEDCRCAGISAGNTGGGECDVKLPKDFYLTHSQKDLAELCWHSCYDGIVKCAKLRTFLAKAKKKGGFCFKNR